MSKSWSTAPGTIKGFAGVVALSLVLGLLTTVYGIATEDLDAGSTGTLPAGTVGALKGLILVMLLGLSAILAGIYGWLTYKLTKGRKWAWIVLLVLESLGLLFGLINLTSGTFTSLLNLILTVVTFGLLLMPDTRDYVEDNGMSPAWNDPTYDYNATSSLAERAPDQPMYTDWHSRSERW